jgi:enoyl-CoA hydratase
MTIVSSDGVEVLLERHGDGTATVRVNRPDARNALNIATRKGLAAFFNELGEDEAIRAIVLTGSDEMFVAGADIRDMVDIGAVEMMQRRSERWWAAVAGVPQPVIAAVNGYALGGGLELAMCCDVIIAGRGAKLGLPEVRLGIIPGAGGTQRLTRAVGKFKAMRMILNGELVDAEEAFAMGLVSQVTDDAETYEDAMKMARALAKLPPLSVQSAKEAVNLSEDVSLQAGLFMERKAVQVLFASHDKKEGMSAFLEKRKPDFKGE